MHFRDSPDSLNGLRIPENIWLGRFAVKYTLREIYLHSIVYTIELNRADSFPFVL